MARKTQGIAAVAALGAALTLPAWAPAQDVGAKVDALTKEVESLKEIVKKTQDRSHEKWLDIGGDYRFRVDSLRADVVAHADAMAFGTTFQALLPRMFLGATSPAAWQAATDPTQLDFVQMTPAQRAEVLGGLQQQAMNMIGQLSVLTPAQLGAFMGVPANAALFGQMATVLGLTPAQQGQIMGDPSSLQSVMFGQVMQQAKALKPDDTIRNNLLYTNRFGLDLKAKATKDISVTARLTMYKTFGSVDDDATTGGYFADRVGAFDGTLGHTPSSDFLSVDRVYATWSNIGGQPVWFSVGRRPSTGGAPGHVRQLGDGPGKAGVPSLLVDYAFDGMTLGFAPDLEALPGMFAKICYGRGFESGISRTGGANLRDTDMVGVSVVPYDTKALRLDLQWNRGSHIFDFPKMYGTGFGDTAPAADLGAIDWLGLGALGEVKAANLTWFASYGLSFTHPNDNVSANAGNQGLLTGEFFAQDTSPDDKTGWAVYLGGRYDHKATGTSLGAEYNHGSKNWITFAPAADDMWTAKLGTRGNVYEVYAIQNLNLAPVSSFFSKAFFRLGYQYYDFEYTGSNNWVGAPQKIDDLSATDLALLAPVEKAYNLYGTFQVNF